MLKGHNIRRLNPRPARARGWALAMTELPSVSGSAEEAAFPEKLVALLRATPPFADQPESVWMILVPGGRHQRACVAALVRGKGTRTVLLGHFDVPTIAGNTPAWGAGLHWTEGRAFAGIPIVNAGPWGRDYHTVLERLHTPYAFNATAHSRRKCECYPFAPSGRQLGVGAEEDYALES